MKNVFIFLILVSSFFASASTCTCTTGNVTIANGGTSSTNITVGSGESWCIIGPTTGGQKGTYSGTVTIPALSTGTICISGNIDFTGTFDVAYSAVPNFRIVTNAIVNFTGTWDINGGYSFNSTFTNDGTFNYNKGTGVGGVLSFIGTQLTNTGTITSQGGIGFSDNGIAATHSNSGTITVAEKFDYTAASFVHTFNNNSPGVINANTMTLSGDNALSFFNIGVNTVVNVTGTTGAPGVLSKGSGTVTVNGTVNVPNGNADWNSTSSIFITGGASGRMYFKTFSAPSFIVSATNCLSIQVDGLMDMNFGSVLSGKVYILDKTPTLPAGSDNGDKYGGSSIFCGTPQPACTNAWAPTSMFYSGTDSPPAGCSILPLETIQFTGTHFTFNNKLSWKGYYSDIYKIYIEKSSNGIDYSSIGLVKPGFSNSSILQSFDYLDNILSSDEIVYYRLKYVGNKTISFSHSIKVNQMLNLSQFIKIYPTVSHGEDIEIQSDLPEFNWSIVNVLGIEISSGFCHGDAIAIMTNNISDGTYFIHIDNPHSTETFKVLIQK